MHDRWTRVLCCLIAIYIAVYIAACRSHAERPDAAAAGPHAGGGRQRTRAEKQLAKLQQTSPAPSGFLNTALRGYGVFYVSSKDKQRHAKLWISGSFDAPKGVTVNKIDFQGGTLLIEPLHGDIEKPNSVWHRTFTRPWDGGTTYYFIVHYTYVGSSGSDTEYTSYGGFEDIMEPVEPIAMIDNASFRTCTGTFNRTQHLALYDLQVAFSDLEKIHAKPLTNVSLKEVKVSAGPSGQTMIRLLDQTQNLPDLSAGWSSDDLEGGYDGSQAYSLKVEIDYSDDSKDVLDHDFTNIQQGTIIPLSLY